MKSNQKVDRAYILDRMKFLTGNVGAMTILAYCDTHRKIDELMQLFGSYN